MDVAWARARSIGVALAAAVLALPAALVFLAAWLIRGRPVAYRFGARRTAGLLRALGPAFVKVGQLVGTRRDMLHPAVSAELAALQDSVRPMARRRGRRALIQAYGADLAALFPVVDERPVAGGSVACVYRAVLGDGREVALKLQRPGVAARMTADLGFVRTAVGWAARLPWLRGVPVVEMVGNVCDAVGQQVDFVREADNLVLLRKHLGPTPAALVPEVHPALCRSTCVAMEFVPGLRLRPASDFSPGMRRDLADKTLDVVFQMLFVEGFVHCDLHPGNLYYTDEGRVVVLDAGFCVWMADKPRREFAEFFFNVGRGNGRRCAEVMIESAVAGAGTADRERFTTEIVELVRRTTRVPAKDFSLIEFTAKLFDLQRECGLYPSADFVFPLLSILALEGTLRDLDPELDFQSAATPYLLRAIAKR
ncbi:MAG TPA: AarF/UbiB family protein [Actinoplanes sp.]|jgi:ubiquinone biosynthesis protein|nr:AarF/UbiB family protein [Actinoplanes sp.]